MKMSLCAIELGQTSHPSESGSDVDSDCGAGSSMPHKKKVYLVKKLFSIAN